MCADARVSRKHLQNTEPTNQAPVASQTPQPPLSLGTSQNWGDGIVNPSDISNLNARRWSGSTMSNDVVEEFQTTHVSHPICKWNCGWKSLTMLIGKTKLQAVN